MPVWSAAIVQFPVANAVTVVPLSVQIVGVVELKTTPRPDVAVPLTVVVPVMLTLAGKKLIVPIDWFCLVGLMLPVTWGAAL